MQLEVAAVPIKHLAKLSIEHNSFAIFFSKRCTHEANFSEQLRKVILRYKCMGYNINAMNQTACVAFDPIMVNRYDSLLNCTPVDRG